MNKQKIVAQKRGFIGTAKVGNIDGTVLSGLHGANTIGPFIRGKIRRVLNKTRTFRINGTFRLK